MDGQSVYQKAGFFPAVHDQKTRCDAIL